MYLRPNLIVIGKAGSDTPKSLDRTSAIACGANDWNEGRKGVFGP
jgi:hypothetical protein